MRTETCSALGLAGLRAGGGGLAMGGPLEEDRM